MTSTSPSMMLDRSLSVPIGGLCSGTESSSSRAKPGSLRPSFTLLWKRPYKNRAFPRHSQSTRPFGPIFLSRARWRRTQMMLPHIQRVQTDWSSLSSGPRRQGDMPSRTGRSTPGPGHRRPHPLPTRSSTPSLPRAQPRIQVSSLLEDPSVRFYHLEVVQHPTKTAAFENNLLSRLALSPPLIVRLTVRDPSGNSVVPDDELPFLIAHLSLLDEHGVNQIDRGSSPGSGPQSHVLYGNLVSAIDQPFEDLQGNLGLFFLFPDVSVRWIGRFRLRVTLVRISSVDSFTGAVSLARQGSVLAETRSSAFEVVSASQYTAIAQTRLTQSFIRQGARISPYS